MKTRTLPFIILGLACCPVSLPGQQAPETPRVNRAEVGPEKEGPTAVTPGKTQFANRTPRYQVQPGDVIEILFTPSTEFNQTVAVQPDGFVTLREVGDVHVRSKTIPELTSAIKTAYAKILRDPTVTVVLKEFEKPHFVVNGQVGRPGKFELRADTTVSEAIGIAGGFTERAKHSQVLLFRRVSEDWVEAKKLDLKAILNGGQFQEDVHLRPGDMLFVPQNTISKVRPYLPTTSLGAYFGANSF